jgi:hypothetical protein
MLYQGKTFTVPVGTRKPEDCKHGWWTKEERPKCVFCGEPKIMECTACHCDKMKGPHYHGEDEFATYITGDRCYSPTCPYQNG